MKFACCLTWILCSSLQWHASGTSLFKRSLSGDLFKPLLAQGSSRSDPASGSGKTEFFAIRTLPSLNCHNRGSSWLTENLVFTESVGSSDRILGKISHSRWLEQWTTLGINRRGLASVRRPYNFEDIPFIDSLVKAYMGTSPTSFGSKETEKLEAAIRDAAQEILHIEPKTYKEIDVLAQSVGVLALITAAGKGPKDLSPANQFSRQYLLQWMEKICLHFKDQGNLKALALWVSSKIN